MDDALLESKAREVGFCQRNRLIFMMEPAKWGIIDYSGKVISQPVFTHTNKFENGKMTLQKEDGKNYTVFYDGRIEEQ